jgi:hypothetical protein
VSFLRSSKSLGRVLHGLPGNLVTAQMVLLPVMRRGGTVCVRGEFVKFRGSPV